MSWRETNEEDDGKNYLIDWHLYFVQIKDFWGNNSLLFYFMSLYWLTMTGFGRASSKQTALSGWPNRQPWGSPRDSSFRWEEEPRQKAQVMRERLLLNGFWEKSEETTQHPRMHQHRCSIFCFQFLWGRNNLTCRFVQCFSGSRLQDELALLVHLQLLHLHGPLSVCRWCSSVLSSLRCSVSHMIHLDAEGKLVTWDTGEEAESLPEGLL